MELSLTLQEHLAFSTARQRHLCSRQALGVRMARLACSLLDVDPELRPQRIFVYMESGHCLAEGVRAVTGASQSNRLMELLPIGVAAATFVDLDSGLALRVWERQRPPMPTDLAWSLSLDACQRLADDELLGWRAVQLNTAPSKLLRRQTAVCERCGMRVHGRAPIACDGLTLCEVCAGGVYSEMSTALLAEPLPRDILNAV